MFNFDDMTKHNWAIVALVISNFFIYIAMVGFNGLSATNYTDNNYLFPNSVGGLADSLYIDITPASWVFSTVWSIIFIWNFIWIVYAVVCLFRRTSDGSYLYRKVQFLHWGIFVSFTFNNLVIIAWLFVWTNKFVGWAMFLIVFAALSVDICLLILTRQLHYLNGEMNRLKLRGDIITTRILALNGLGVFATWLALATNLNFAQFLTYDAGAKNNIGATIALINIFVLAVAYSIFENFFWQRFLLYLFTPWVVIIFALIGSLTKNWVQNSPSRNNIITLVLMIVVIALAILKIVMFIVYKTVWKHKLIKNNPINPTTDGPLLSEKRTVI